MNEEEL